MQFSEFVSALFRIMDMEPVVIGETTNLKNELEIDSLQMVNLITGIAEHYKIPFEKFIENLEKIETVGGLFEVVKGGVINEIG